MIPISNYCPKGIQSGMSLFSYALLLSIFLFHPAMLQASCYADAGALGTSKVCLTNGKTVLTAVPNGDAQIPDGFIRLYVLTSGDELVIEQISPLPSFEVDPQGLYTLHTLIYDPETLDLSIVEPGVTTGFDVNGLLIQGGGDICAALDVKGVKFAFDDCEAVCNAFAGSLKPVVKDCFAEGQTRLTAEPVAAPLAPEGFSVIYVLTSGDELIIEDADDAPSFVVEDEGRYTIHTLVYDPETLDLGIIDFGATTGFDVNNLLVQGGGDICAALDVAGAVFYVEKCTAELACKADAGQLKPKSKECIDNGQMATIIAKRTKAANLPTDDYELIYVLTSGDDLVIEAVSDEPEFEIENEGKYTIHTLVYKPETLDLGIVEFGETTGFDVNGLLLQGGGDICAALDVEGAKFLVENCEKCELTVGHLQPRSVDCLENKHKSVRLSAYFTRKPTGPRGYKLLFVLTKGEELVIQKVNTYPRFYVDEAGMYTIHTLVYDPETLDLSIVELGETTGFDVNSLLIQGGGDICAALDVEGAKFNVKDCDEECTADFGDIEPKSSSCYRGYGWVKIRAKLTKHPVVPHGYKVVYIATTGEELTIRGASYHPVFYVRGTGRVTIHTLVYNPHTLDLKSIDFGETTGAEVNKLLIQGGGNICAALDVEGAPFYITRCKDDDEHNYHLQSADPSPAAPRLDLEVSIQNDPKAYGDLPTMLPGLNIQTINEEEAQMPKLYPNPATERLQLDLPTVYSGKKVAIEILDTNGNAVKQLMVMADSEPASVDIADLPKGMYALRIKTEEGLFKNMLFTKF